jgi:leucyl aminopeptidase
VETGSGPDRIVGDWASLPPGSTQRLTTSLPALADDWNDEAVLTFPAPREFGAELLTLVSIGTASADESTVVRLRRAAGAAARSARSVRRLVFALPMTSDEEVAAVVEGAVLGRYAFAGLHGPRAPRRPPDLASIHLLGPDETTLDSGPVRRALQAACAVNEARDLVNLPPNELYPESFASLAAEAAHGLDEVVVTTWDHEALATEGFGGLVGVGQGSVHGPRLVRIGYAPADARGHLALVGKGITFDSGGLNIKTAALDYMNFDMSGAAAVLATVVAAARLQLAITVTGWLALAENLPSATAQRPSDVLRMRDGTTVEVRDTDAEGRLVLADAITAACLEDPDVLVDIATLTGAQEEALGTRTSAVMSNSPELAERLARVAIDLDEPHWVMPLPAHLGRGLRSEAADLANMGERPGGMLTAALFLQHFVDGAATVPAWAHFDVCGPAINRKQPYGFTPSGGTGVGVRTLLALAADLAAEPEAWRPPARQGSRRRAASGST